MPKARCKGCRKRLGVMAQRTCVRCARDICYRCGSTVSAAAEWNTFACVGKCLAAAETVAALKGVLEAQS